MKPFEFDYPKLKLSKYFMIFLEKICHKNEFLVYYNPSSSNFVISDKTLNEDYRYYKTSQDISVLDNSYKSKEFKWKQKNIILFDKEEPYEQNDGEYYYPDYCECNHNIEFKVSLVNLQKILLNIFKNPILAEHSYSIQELFYISDINTYFPSKTLNIEPMLDLLLVKNLEQRYLLECLTGKNSHQKTLIEHLKKQSDEYLIDFFKLFSKKDLNIKDIIFETSHDQVLLEKITESFPQYQKFLLKNKPNEFLTKPTEKITIHKSYFNTELLSIAYHDKFTPNDIQNLLIDTLNNSSIKELLDEKNITIHHTYFDYHSQSVISIIENNSKINIHDFEVFISESFHHLEKQSFSNQNQNIEKFKKFWNYFYQSTILNETSPKKTMTNKI